MAAPVTRIMRRIAPPQYVREFAELSRTLQPGYLRFKVQFDGAMQTGLCCVRDCKIRKAAGQRNHINCSIRAFVRLEVANLREKISLYDAKWKISKPVIMDI